MRMMVVDTHMDANGLSARLLKGEGSAHALDEIKRLNPHVDFRNIDAGTVLLVPDVPGVQAGEEDVIAGDAFELLRRQILSSMEVAHARIREGFASLHTQQRDVAELMKEGSLRNALRQDPALAQQVADSHDVFAEDARRASETDEMMRDARARVADELETLARLLR